MDALDAAADAVASLGRRPLPWQPDFRPLEARPQGSLCAVDGSSAVLVDNGAVWVVAHRAAAVAWPAPRPIERPAEVTAAAPSEADGLLEARAAAQGDEPARVRSAEQFAEALRRLDEAKAARAACARLGAGGLLLVDGALRGLPEAEQRAADRLLFEAGRHGVRVVAVAKRSGLGAAGVPLVPRLQAAGPPGAWLCPVPDREGTFVARLHPRSPFAFRVDGEPGDVARLLESSRDAAYPGYPYPLALAHNAVALTASHAAELREALLDRVRRRGGTDGLLADFHDVLDRAVPG